MHQDTSTERRTTRDKASGLSRLQRMVSERLRARPLLVAGLTAAAGFVVGGGLASGTTLRVVRRSVGLALQMAVIPVLLNRLRESLLDEVES